MKHYLRRMTDPRNRLDKVVDVTEMSTKSRRHVVGILTEENKRCEMRGNNNYMY